MKKHVLLILVCTLLLSADAFAQRKVGSLWVGGGTAPASYKIFTKQSVTSAGWIIEESGGSAQLGIYLDGTNINFVSSSATDHFSFTGANASFGGVGSGSARLIAKGTDTGSGNYAFAAQDSGAVNLFLVRNDGQVSVAGALLAGSLAIGSGTAITKHLSATASLNFGATAAQTCDALTITVTGAADGDAVALGTPASAYTDSNIFWAYVSAADTVTVRRCNITGSPAADIGAATFRADVWKH